MLPRLDPLTPAQRAFVVDIVLADAHPRAELLAMTDAELVALVPMTPTGPLVESVPGRVY